MGGVSDKKLELKPIQAPKIDLSQYISKPDFSHIEIDLGGNKNYGQTGDIVNLGNTKGSGGASSDPVIERARTVADASDKKNASGALSDLDSLNTDETAPVENAQAAADEAMQNVDSAEGFVADKTGEVTDAKEQLSAATGKVTAQEAAIADDRKNYLEAQNQTRLANLEVTSAKKLVSIAEKSLADAQKAEPASPALVAAAQSQLSAAKKQLATAEENYKKAKEAEEAAKTKLDTDTIALPKLKTAEIKAKTNVTKISKDLNTAIGALGKAQNLFAQKTQEVETTSSMTESEKNQIRAKLYALINELESSGSDSDFNGLNPMAGGDNNFFAMNSQGNSQTGNNPNNQNSGSNNTANNNQSTGTNPLPISNFFLPKEKTV